MARKINIDVKEMKKLRKLKKRKKLVHKLILILVLVAAGFTIYFTKNTWLPFFDGIITRYIPEKNNTGEIATGNFPIKISGSSDYQCEVLDNYIAVLSDAKLTSYTPDGQVVFENQCNLKNAIMKTNGKKALIYDTGGMEFRLDSKYKNIYSKKIDDKIKLGRIAQNDYVAIVTQSDKFLSVMTVYDSAGNFIYRWKSVEGRIIDVAFTNLADGCIVTVIGSRGGSLISELYYFKFDSSDPKEVWRTPAMDTLALNTTVLNDGSIILTGYTKCYYLSRNGEITGSYTYPSDLLDYSIKDGIAAFVFEKSERRETSVTIIGDTTENIVNFKTDLMTKGIEVYGSKIYVMSDKNITAYSKNGEKINDVTITDEYNDFRKIDKYIYLLENSQINRIDFNS